MSVVSKVVSASAKYITTPIFYVNSKPHLGHLYSMTLCDVHNRWNKLMNRETFFTTGTDEHGLKVQTAAFKANTPPKIFCDDLAHKFEDLADKAQISYDRFIRTTDPDHLVAVTHFWNAVMQKGYIYKGTHGGWYSVSDEAFYPEKDTQVIKDEKTNKEIRVSTETGSEVVYEEEENYFFKLSDFKEKLIEMYKDSIASGNPIIKPAKHLDAIIHELETQDLKDLSISRPKERLTWGLEVPHDSTQVVYVWFDALVNYLTSLGYPNAGHNTIQELPRLNHLIGKDIARFHCIYWPAFLLAADLQPPKNIYVHGHWLMGGSKMSKSRGNVADPIELGAYYDYDALRWFMMRYSSLESDSDFSEIKLNEERDDLISKPFNTAMRLTSKSFNPEETLGRIKELGIQAWYDYILSHQDVIAQLDPIYAQKLVEQCKEIISEVDSLPSSIDKSFQDMDIAAALSQVWSKVRILNQFLAEFKPWSIKVDSVNDSVEIQEAKTITKDLIVFTILDSLRTIFILLQPVIPSYADKLLSFLRVSNNKRSGDYAKVGADFDYFEGIKDEKPKVLLARVKVPETE